MAFFLLGRTADGMLSLLSDTTFESRQDALAELSHITGDPAFTSWDDEVVLIDLDAGTPVLLVRPNGPPADAVVAREPDVAPEPAAFAVMADESPAAAPLIMVEASEPEPPAEPEVEAEPDDGRADDAAIAEAEPGDSSAPAIDVETSDDFVWIGSPEYAAPEVVPQTSELSDGDSETEAGDTSLRDAIARTTEHMEASGIVAPSSIPSAVDADGEPDSEPELPAETPASDEVAETPVTEQAKWPWSSPPRSTPDVVDANPDSPQIEVAFLLEGLEEPAIDDGGSLITSSIDDAALTASRPMILGAYGDLADAPEAQGLSGDSPVQLRVVERDAPDEETAPPEESDFIVLDPTPESADATTVALPDAAREVAPVTQAAGAPVGSDDVLSLSAYTCEDCVYVETCPNKDERRPQDCGSFQWK